MTTLLVPLLVSLPPRCHIHSTIPASPSICPRLLPISLLLSVCACPSFHLSPAPSTFSPSWREASTGEGLSPPPPSSPVCSPLPLQWPSPSSSPVLCHAPSPPPYLPRLDPHTSSWLPHLPSSKPHSLPEGALSFPFPMYPLPSSLPCPELLPPALSPSLRVPLFTPRPVPNHSRLYCQ